MMKRAIYTLMLLILAYSYVFAQNWNHEVMIQSDFERGDLDDWGPRGDAGAAESVAVVRTQAHSGSGSLYISEREKTWHGPIHLLTDNAVAGDVFRISSWVYREEGPENAAIVFSVERSFKDENAAHAYANVKTFQIARGEWTRIEAEYTVGADPTQKNIWIYFELPYKSDDMIEESDKMSFYLDDVECLKLDPESRPKAQTDIPNLYDNWISYFDVGVSVTPTDVDFTSQTAQLLMKHFTALVSDNAQKMDSLQPNEGEYNWSMADKIVEFGALTGMRQRWHTLVWHQQNPGWLFQDPNNANRQASKTVMEQRLESYISTVMDRYSFDVESWDVVNEVLNESGGLRTGAQGSPWYDIMGAEYIDKAFRYARAADSSAQLVINDYNLVSNPQKRQGMYNLVKGLLDRGVPVDAIGMQMHISLYDPPVSEVRETIELFGSLGVKVLVTELDISIHRNDSEGMIEVTDAILQKQADLYRDLFDLFKEQADKGVVDMVMIWGATDAGSWKNDFPVKGRGDAPLLFDERLQAKPAFYALVE